MFEIDNSLEEKGCVKRYEKKHREECASCLENLLEVKEYLNAGMRLQQVLRCCSYLRSEGADIYRIGQTGIVGAKETRLYVYVRIVNGKIYKLTFGDKDSQQRDINRCKQIVRKFKKTI